MCQVCTHELSLRFLFITCKKIVQFLKCFNAGLNVEPSREDIQTPREASTIWFSHLSELPTALRVWCKERCLVKPHPSARGIFAVLCKQLQHQSPWNLASLAQPQPSGRGNCMKEPQLLTVQAEAQNPLGQTSSRQQLWMWSRFVII